MNVKQIKDTRNKNCPHLEENGVTASNTAAGDTVGFAGCHTPVEERNRVKELCLNCPYYPAPCVFDMDARHWRRVVMATILAS